MDGRSTTEPGKRAYHSPTRQRQAEETRRSILAAARALFLHYGYAGATIDAIAKEAGVSAKTVVAAFGSKRDILAALVNPPAIDPRHQEILGQLRTVPDPERRVEITARFARQVYETLAPELDLLRGATAVAPEVAEVARQVESRRHETQTRLIAYLHEQGALRRNLAVEEAVDILWALTSFDLYRALVIVGGWALDRYESWLAGALSQQLLARPYDEAES